VESNRRSIKKRTQAERDELVAAWRASGKSVPVFAQERGLASSSLYQWINPAKKRPRSADRGGKRPKRKPSTKAAFAQVNVIGREIAGAAVMTVALRGGHSVSFEGPAVDPRWLEAVLKVVAAC
jgi:transposase-like protein